MRHDEFEAAAARAASGPTTAEEAAAMRAHVRECEQCRTVYGDLRDESAPAPPVVVEGRRRGLRWWLATAGLMFLALWLWREMGIRAARERIQAQQIEIQHLTEAGRLQQQHEEKSAGELGAVAAPDAQVRVLAPAATTPAASGRVFVSTHEQRAVAFFYGLPAVAPGKTYEFWTVPAAGDPQGATFSANESGSGAASIGDIASVEGLTFRVTVEPKDGAKQPTGPDVLSGRW